MQARWGVERGEWPAGSEVEPDVTRNRGCRLSLLSTFSFEMIGTTAASAQRRSATTRSDSERFPKVDDAELGRGQSSRGPETIKCLFVSAFLPENKTGRKEATNSRL